MPTLRGTRLGISAGPFASVALMDECVKLGLKYVRVSHESGWPGTLDALKTTVQAAHLRGLKIIQCVQNSGHKYDDPIKNAALVQFAVDCVAYANCDVIEVGNEFNNRMFWVAPDVSVTPPVAQSNLSLTIAKRLRTLFPTLPVITNGLSPAADPLNPWTFLPAFWDVSVSAHKAVGWSGIGLHPFCYPELATTNPAQWNPIKQVPTILSKSKQRGINCPVWLTEIGAPGFLTNAPVIRGIALTEARQADCYRAYISVIKQQETVGISYPAICFATLYDGQSATNSVEQGLGLIRKDGTHKPAYDLVRAFALESLP